MRTTSGSRSVHTRNRGAVSLCLLTLAALTFAALILVAAGSESHAQYFGRNKVRWESFDFQVLETERFLIHNYLGEPQAADDFGRMAERWYSRLETVFRHSLPDRSPIIVYANPTDFQQTNVIRGFIGEGVGGVTEGMKNRIVMPVTGVYRETDHVLGHELVHVFQFDIAQGDTSRLALERLPLWFVEGMSEYLTLGRVHPHTAMWMRDAIVRDEFPTIDQMSRDPQYFPYRFGQAFWAYVAGTWGDDIIGPLFRAAGRVGVSEGIQTVVGISADSLSVRWREATREAQLPVAEARLAPREQGDLILTEERGSGTMNLAPATSPDGRLVAFLAEQALFAIELFLADAQTGEIIQRLTRTESDPHFDALRFLDSAGAWSPDGSRLAFVVTRRGDNQIAILDVERGRVERRIRVPDAGGLSNPAWSPDGSRMVVSGSSGGISDLYLVELATGAVRRLTHDRYADLQPTFSPDGTTIAFTTDRGPGTDLDILLFGDMRIGLYNLESGQIEVLAPFADAKNINPQFGPGGRDLYFISDYGGVSDIFRIDLDTRVVHRVTNISTGVSGVTELSPAMSVSPLTGRVLFSVFEDREYNVYGRDAADAQGMPVEPNGMLAATLPPVAPPGPALIAGYLADPITGLPAGGYPVRNYNPRLQLDYVGIPVAGVAIDRYGTAVGGAVGLYFSDMLATREVGAAVQMNGGLEDLGGQAYFESFRSRWTWGVSVGHLPYLSIFTTAGIDTVTVDGQPVQGITYRETRERQFTQRVNLIGQYPFSQTRRAEAGIGYSRIGWSREQEVVRTVNGRIISRQTRDLDTPDGLNLMQNYVALVGDNSFFGFTSPVAGQRWRLEFESTVGSLQFQTVLADYRRYVFLRPVTLAARGLHYGRYGHDVGDDALTPFFIGYANLVRGYSSGSFRAEECSGPGCPEFERLIGDRIGVLKFEARVPVLGTRRLGLVHFPAIPVEIAAFADIGTAWNPGDSPHLVLETDSTRRVPVVGTGLTSRVNVLGAAVVEIFWAYPHMRPERGGHFGFHLAPGW